MLLGVFGNERLRFGNAAMRWVRSVAISNASAKAPLSEMASASFGNERLWIVSDGTGEMSTGEEHSPPARKRWARLREI
jgi:hypothetical protein